MVKTEKYLSLLAGAVALALGACAAPEENPMLNQARAAYSMARSDPRIIQKAPLELNQAAQTLQEAETLYQSDAHEREVSHRAYLANQQVAIAQQAAQLKMTEEAIADAEVQRQQAMLQAQSSEAQRARQEAARSQRELEQVQARMSEAERTRQAELARQQSQMREQEIARLQQQVSEAEMRRTPSGIVLSFKDVLFPVGKADLNPGAQRSISKIAEFLKDHPEQTVAIEGFTDSTGAADFNRQLSQERAQAVRSALVQHGIEGERITSRGFGEQYPVASNDTPAGRQMNRRVEIAVSTGAEGGTAGTAAAGRRMGQAGETRMTGIEGMNLNSAGQLIGLTVRDRQGEEIGEVQDVMINYEKGRAGFVRVTSRDGKSYLVPMSVLTSEPAGNSVTLNADRSLIESSPLPQAGMTEEQYGRALYEHYGLAYPWEEAPAESPVPEQETPSGAQ
jgi:outer membrane protein OmpA-like peptidoglycan-associated protein